MLKISIKKKSIIAQWVKSGGEGGISLFYYGNSRNFLFGLIFNLLGWLQLEIEKKIRLWPANSGLNQGGGTSAYFRMETRLISIVSKPIEFVVKLFWLLKRLSKNFGQKKNCLGKYTGSKKICDKTIFWSTNFWVKKDFWSKRFLVKEFLGRKNVWVKKIFGS